MSDYRLSSKNYINEETEKTRIVIGNTFSVNMNHYIGWTKRLNGEFKRTANYTITIDGEIHEHFLPKYYSNYLNDKNLNKSSIVILLENEGWLVKDLFDENRYNTYIGHIYNGNDVIEKRWRNYKYWSSYSEVQMESLSKIVKKLCNDFDIPLKVVSHNTNFDGIEKYSGITYRSNFEKFYTDVNPTWDFTKFKDNIELN
jgi:hypothetical protein